MQFQSVAFLLNYAALAKAFACAGPGQHDLTQDIYGNMIYSLGLGNEDAKFTTSSFVASQAANCRAE